MLCKKCGTDISDDIKFCPNCGAQNDIMASNVQGEVNNQQPMMEQPVSDVAPVQQPMNYTTPVQQPINDVSSAQQSMYNQPMNNQSMNYNQQPTPEMNNNYSYNNMGGDYNNGNNKASTGLIVGVFIAVIAAAGVIYFSFNDKGKNKDSNSNSNVVSNSNITSTVNSNVASQITSNKPSNTTSQITSNITSQITSNKTSNITSQITSNKTSQVTSNKTSQVTSNKVSNTNNNYFSASLREYNLQIPTKYREYKENGTKSDSLLLVSKDEKYLSTMGIYDSSYETYRNNIVALDNSYKQAGMKVVESTKIVTYNGVEFIVSCTEYDSKKTYAAMAKLSNNKVLVITLAGVENNVPKSSQFADFAYTVKTAKVK